MMIFQSWILTILLFVSPTSIKTPSTEVVDTNGIIDKIIVKNIPTTTTCSLFKSKSSSNQILGEWEAGDNCLQFIPSVPLSVHRTYYIKTAPKAYGWIAVKPPVGIPTETAPRVLNVYPKANKLPENLLRFYVEFSEPMVEDDFLSNVSLLDENGADLTGVFLPSRYEYWNKQRTKITLIFDPGRVKTGLIAHQKMGRALVPGKSYQLVIQPNCRSLNGKTTTSAFIKKFTVTEAINRAVDPDLWLLQKPETNTRTPLEIGFDRVVDHINAEHYIAVFSADQNQVSGGIELDETQTKWSFTPKAVWKPGKYTIKIYNKLEDVCGNNLIHGFDVYKASEVASRNHESVSTLKFVIAP